MDIGTFNFGLAGIGLAVVYALGFLSAVDAVMKTRTPQGTTAWVFALATVPLVAIPLYFILGRSRFDDYVDALRTFDNEIADGLEQASHGALKTFKIIWPNDLRESIQFSHGTICEFAPEHGIRKCDGVSIGL